MDLASWAESADPGQREDSAGRVVIRHSELGVSTLWHRAPSTVLPPAIQALRCYELWDGADLFGSAFKLASVEAPRFGGAVVVVPALAALEAETAHLRWRLPTGAAPFMVGSGQWLYAATLDGTVLEFDLEELQPGGVFGCLEQVLQEWLDNVRK